MRRASAGRQSCESGLCEKVRTGRPPTPTDASSVLSSDPQTLEKSFPAPAAPKP